MADTNMTTQRTSNAAARRPAGSTLRRWARGAGVVALLLVAGGGSSAQTAQERIESLRETIRNYHETVRLISKERDDWALDKQMLEEQIDLLSREIESIEENIAEAEEEIERGEAEYAKVEAEKEELEEATDVLDQHIGSLEARTRRILGKLPTPALDQVRTLSQQLPDEDEDVNLSLGQRYSFVIGILNEIDKLNGMVTIKNEFRQLSAERKAEVTTLYVGVGHGYYVSADGTAAGIGAARGGEWTWTEANEAAPEIQKAIAILEGNEVASFVPLPIQGQENDE